VGEELLITPGNWRPDGEIAFPFAAFTSLEIIYIPGKLFLKPVRFQCRLGAVAGSTRAGVKECRKLFQGWIGKVILGA
jgi:hypothetical protein